MGKDCFHKVSFELFNVNLLSRKPKFSNAQFQLKLYFSLYKRVEGRLIEFRKMRSSYAHYVDKVQGLHQKADKQKARSKQVPAKASLGLSTKLERNVLKLSGAEEAHDDYGRSLLVYIEEVTTTYWKDFIPLLHMVMKFSINHSSDMASVMMKLEKIDAVLKNNGIGVAGRLGELKSSPPELIISPNTVKEIKEERVAKESDDLESV